METVKKKSFALGYSFIAHSFISYMFLAFVLVAVSNNVLPSFYHLLPEGFVQSMGGVEKAMLLVNTLCAVFSAVAGIFLGQWVDRKGPKQVLVIGYLVGGINYLVFPFVQSFAALVVCLALTHTSMLAYCQMTTHSLVAHWFNRKKGMALGVSAVGIPTGNAVFSLVYTTIVSSFGSHLSLGVRAGLWTFGAALIIMGVVSVFWVKNTPAEVGMTPDNLPIENEVGSVEDRSYTFGEVARTPYVWLIILIYGLLNCAVIACVAQLINYIQVRGNVGMDTAGLVMSVGALGGIAGGFLISFMDQKLGTKKTTVLYCIASILVYAAMGLFGGNITVLVVLCMLAFLLNGGPAPLLPSMILTIFGPESFNSVSKIATPIACICRSCGYYVVALFMFPVAGLDIWSGVYFGLAALAAVSLVLVTVCRTRHVEIKTKNDPEDIFSMGEVYFGFNTNFQADVRKIKELLYGRGNTGLYVPGAIPEEDIREIVEAGTFVPEGLGVNPWHFVAVSDPAVLDDLRERMHKGVVGFSAKLRERFPGHPELKKDTEDFLASLDRAPLVVMAFTDYPVQGNALADEVKQIGSAFQNMLLKAYGKGIGSYWLTSPIAAGAAPNLKKQFLPDSEGEFIGMVTFGYYDNEMARPLVKKGSVKYI